MDNSEILNAEPHLGLIALSRHQNIGIRNGDMAGKMDGKSICPLNRMLHGFDSISLHAGPISGRSELFSFDNCLFP